MRQVSCLSRTTELVMCCKNYGFAVNTWPFMISETERDISWRLLGERWFLFFEREVLKLFSMVSFTFQPRWSSQDLYLPAGITGKKEKEIGWKLIKQSFSDTGHQAVQESSPWEMGKTEKHKTVSVSYGTTSGNLIICYWINWGECGDKRLEKIMVEILQILIF